MRLCQRAETERERCANIAKEHAIQCSGRNCNCGYAIAYTIITGVSNPNLLPPVYTSSVSKEAAQNLEASNWNAEARKNESS